MIYIYEPWATGEMHIEFNKAFFQSLSKINENFCLIADKSLIIKVQSMNFKNFSYHAINVPNYDKKGHKIKKILIEFFNSIKVKKIVKKEKLIISNGLPLTMLFLNKKMRKNNLYYIMHGHLAAIKNKYRFTNMDYYMKKALRTITDKSKIIVLGESIKNNAIKLMPELRDKIEFIDHPFLSKNNMLFNSSIEKDKIRIGTIGVGLEKKGILGLNDIVNNPKYLSSKIELYHIGKTSISLRERLSTNIIVPFKTDTLIPASEYLNEISKLNFILYLFPKDSYSLTASGSLFEAFSMGKPIIAIKNSYFEYVLSKIPFVVGFLIDEIDEFYDVIKKIAMMTSEEYEKLCINAHKALEFFSPTIISEQINRILKS